MQVRSSSNVKVIDVSHHQGKINWPMVKADGVVGAFIKATEGGSMVDTCLDANAKGAATTGLKVGFYHYAHPELNLAKDEAMHFVKALAGRHCDFPLVLDIEGAASKIGAAVLTAWCVIWLTEVERLTGHPTMIYTGANFAKSYLGKALGEWPLWVAHYDVDRPMDNGTWLAWSVFQFTSAGTVTGIVGNVDVNAMERSFYNKYVNIPAAPQPTAEDTVKVVVNDVLVAYGRIIDGHVYLPLRKLGEALGYYVEWRSVEASPYINGKVVTAFKLIDGATYVGIRAAAEQLGGNMSFDNKVKKVHFYN